MQPQCDQLHVAGPHLPSGVGGLLQVAEEGPVRKVDTETREKERCMHS